MKGLHHCLAVASVACWLALTPAMAAENSATAKNAKKAPATADKAVKPAAAAPSVKSDAGGKAATVNGSLIAVKDLDAAMRQVQQNMQMQGRPVSDEQVATIRKDVLEDLIRRELLFQESRKRGIKIEAAAVDAEIKKLREQFQQESDYQKALSEMQVTEAEIRSHIEHGLAIQKFVQDEFIAKATITDEQAKSFYDQNPQYFVQPEQVRASHILIKADAAAGDTAKADARKKIDAIQERLKKGEDFAALAKDLSDDPSKNRGGDLGFFKRDMMVKPFEDAAFNLKNPGDLSEVVETPFGFHIIKLAERKPESTLAFQDVQERIVQGLTQQQVKEQVGAFLDQSVQKAKIERFVK